MGENHDTTDEHHSIAADQDDSAMSARALIWVANLAGVTLTERGVLQKLANHAHQDGSSARPTVATIAEWADVEPRHVRRVLNQMLARRLIAVESGDGRKGGRGRATTYRVVIPDEYEPRHWRESRVRAWQEAHSAPPAAMRQRPRPAAKGGQNRHAENAERRTNDAGVSPLKEDIFNTKRRTPMSSQPIREPVPSKNNHSALPHRPEAGRGVGEVIDAMLGEAVECDDPPPAVRHEAATRGPGASGNDVRQQAGIQARLAQSLDPKRQAVRLLCQLNPRLTPYVAETALAELQPNYAHQWAPVIEDLTECADLDPPRDPLVWLAARSLVRAMDREPGSEARQ